MVSASALDGGEPGPGLFAAVAGVRRRDRRGVPPAATNAEIAEKMGRAVPTVERKLARIRAVWKRTPTPDDADE